MSKEDGYLTGLNNEEIGDGGSPFSFANAVSAWAVPVVIVAIFVAIGATLFVNDSVGEKIPLQFESADVMFSSIGA